MSKYILAALLLVASLASADSYDQTGPREAACLVRCRINDQTSVRGTGTLIEDDTVLTAAHLFDSGQSNITVRFQGRPVPATLLRRDSRLDVAALRIAPTTGVKPIRLGKTSPGLDTQVVLWGFGPRVFRAFLGTTQQSCPMPDEPDYMGIRGSHGQTTVPGDSGGAVIYKNELVAVHWGYREPSDSRCVIHSTRCEDIRQWLGAR